ncbi:T9SS type A sorting domain-containing protein, partial [Winogradskyella luteola]
TVNGTDSGNYTLTQPTLSADIFGPVISFNATTSSALEATGSANIEVDLSIAVPITVTVDYTVTGGTASGSGVDYTLAGGTLTFNPNTSGANIAVSIADELIVEPDETIIVTLSNPSNGSLGTNTVHTFTIINDDHAPAIPTVNAQTTGDTSPVITGTTGTGSSLLAGETMTVTVNGATYQVVPDTSGDWSVDTGTDSPSSGSLGAFMNGVSYEVVCTVTDISNNTSVDTSTNEITIDNSLGLNDPSLSASLKLYPNPVQNILHVNANSMDIDQILVYDVLGKSMESVRLENETLDFSNLQAGIYVLKVKTKRGTLVKRVIKQ